MAWSDRRSIPDESSHGKPWQEDHLNSVGNRWKQERFPFWHRKTVDTICKEFSFQISIPRIHVVLMTLLQLGCLLPLQLPRLQYRGVSTHTPKENMQFLSAVLAIKALSDIDEGSVRHVFEDSQSMKAISKYVWAPQLHNEASSCGFSPQLEQKSNYFWSCAADLTERPRNGDSWCHAQ